MNDVHMQNTNITATAWLIATGNLPVGSGGVEIRHAAATTYNYDPVVLSPIVTVVPATPIS